jgi:hypothetical protein
MIYDKILFEEDITILCYCSSAIVYYIHTLYNKDVYLNVKKRKKKNNTNIKGWSNVRV